MTTLQKTKMSIPIAGMTCSACVFHVEKAIQSTSGISTTVVSLGTESAIIEYDEKSSTLQNVANEISNAGYEVVKQSLMLSIENKKQSELNQTISEILEAVPGILSVESNTSSNQVLITFIPGSITQSDIHIPLENSGYYVKSNPAEYHSTLTQIEFLKRTKEINELKRKVTVGLSLGSLIMVLMYLPFTTITLSKFQLELILLILASPVQFWIGGSFYRLSWIALRNRTSNMNTLVVLGTTTAYIYSTLITFFPIYL